MPTILTTSKVFARDELERDYYPPATMIYQQVVDTFYNDDKRRQMQECIEKAICLFTKSELLPGEYAAAVKLSIRLDIVPIAKADTLNADSVKEGEENE